MSSSAGWAYFQYQAGSVFSTVSSAASGAASAGMGLLASAGVVAGSIKVRDYETVRQLYRAVGIDTFDEFDFLLVVHDVSFEYSKAAFNTQVRVIAGEHTVLTEESAAGDFQQPFSIVVEQGTAGVRLELLDKNRQRVVSVLELDVEKDILAAQSGPVVQKLYTMAQKNKAVVNPRIRLSIELEGNAAAAAVGQRDSQVATGSGTKERRDSALGPTYQARASLASGSAAVAPATDEEEALMDNIHGTLERHGDNTDEVVEVFVSVVGPPTLKRFHLAIWRDATAYEQDEDYLETIDLLKVKSVKASGRESHLFEVNYAKDASHDKRQLLLGALTEPRERWIEALKEFIELRHALRAQTRDKRSSIAS